jgi:hypothetical protein
MLAIAFSRASSREKVPGGRMREACKSLNRPYFCHLRHKMPEQVFDAVFQRCC